MKKIIWLIFICVIALLAMPVYAFNPQPDPPGQTIGFGMVGLVTDQTMRINLVSYGGPDTCPVEIRFYDEDGDILGIENTSVEPGQAIYSDFEVLDIPGVDNRVQVRAEVRGIRSPDVKRACRKLKGIVPTLEVFDNTTRRTSLFMVPSKRLSVTDV